MFFAYVFFGFSGCTYRAWYEGFRELERQNCYKIASPREQKECLEKFDEASYDQYKREREVSKDTVAKEKQ